MHFFDASFHGSAGDIWCLTDPFLQNGEHVWGHVFRSGKRLSDLPVLAVNVYKQGTITDFSFTPFGAVVVSETAGLILAKFCSNDVDLHSVSITGQSQNYFIANFHRNLKCLNERESRVVKWTSKEGIPSKIGEYLHVPRLCLNRSQIPSTITAFRIEGWTGPLIVSETVKVAIETHGLTGIYFEKLCLC